MLFLLYFCRSGLENGHFQKKKEKKTASRSWGPKTESGAGDDKDKGLMLKLRPLGMLQPALTVDVY